MKYIMLVLVLAVTACSSTSNHHITDTMSLIAQTAEKAPHGVEGKFEFLIKATGVRRNVVLLNSEQDYRDRRAVTIAIAPHLVAKLTDKYGAAPEDYFINKSIEVTGEARQVKVYFFAKGKRTNKYYFQTHINVSSLAQITVLN